MHNISNKQKPKRIIPHQEEVVKVKPYYEGGMHLETYGHSSLRGLGRALKRKAPIVTRKIIATGRRTLAPAAKATGKAIEKYLVKVGKPLFEDAQKRRAKGHNVFW